MSTINQLTIAIIAGSASSEHDISLISANTIMQALQRLKIKFYPLYLNHQNQLFLLDRTSPAPYLQPNTSQPIWLERVDHHVQLQNDQRQCIDQIDVAFPVLHGRYGEDGVIQGYFELLGLPYVGSGVSASSIAMDKELTKQLLSTVGIATLPHVILRSTTSKAMLPTFDQLRDTLACDALFVKPARAGSSLGISKVDHQGMWQVALDHAFKQDYKVLIEPAKRVRELEVAILQDADTIKASGVGEIRYESGFYDYDQKYTSESKVSLDVPANISTDLKQTLQKQAILAYQTLGCAGLSRVDFFLTSTNQLYLNEINTFPGFTAHSMYPMLWQEAGLSIEDLVGKLIYSATIRKA